MGAPDVIASGKDTSKNTNLVDIDTALVLTEHRWFHWKLLLIGGFAFLATGFEFTLHAYILPFAKCDLHIDAAAMGVINACFLGGGLVSSLFWGIAADAWGRRQMLMYATILEGILTVASSFSVNYYMFTAIRTCCGFLCGCGATILLSYVGEFCSNKIRPRNLCMLGFAWTTSWSILPGMAALLLPLKFTLDLGFVTYRSWRLFVALVGTPNIIAGICIMLFLPESPKYCFASGDQDRALTILRRMFVQNTKKAPEDYPVNRLCSGEVEDTEKMATKEEIVAEEKKKRKKSMKALFINMMSQMRQLFKPPLLWSTMLSSSVYICGMFGYYGLGLWLPTLFDRFEDFYKEHPNDTVSICQLPKMDLNFENSTLEQCGNQELNLAVFTNTFIIGAGCSAGNILATYMSNKLPVRTLTSMFLAMTSACVFILYFVSSPIAVVTLSALFMGAGNAGISIHNACAINLFPTSIRGMGMCISFLFGRVSAVLSSLVFGLLIDVQCSIPIFMVGAVILLGSGCAMMIPKSSQKAKE